MPQIDSKVNCTFFESISGEASPWMQGQLCGFIRFCGCNLDCAYCDAQNENFGLFPFDSLIGWALYKQNLGRPICLTGGEPLLKRDVVNQLLFALNPKKVFIETNGTIDFADYIGLTNLVVDYKLHVLYDGVPHRYFQLRNTDFIKFVITEVTDIQKAMKIQKTIQKENKEVQFAYSPLLPDKLNNEKDFERLRQAVQRIYFALHDNNLNAAVNIQLHKLLGFN